MIILLRVFSGLSFAIFSGLLLGFQYLPIEILRRCENEFFPCNGKHYIIL